MLAGIPKIPPVDSIGWIPAMTFLAALLVIAVQTRGDSATFVTALAVLATAGGGYLIGKPVFAQHSDKLLHTLVPGCAIVALIGLTARASAIRSYGFVTWGSWAIFGGLGALAFVAASSALLGALLGACATVAGLFAAASILFNKEEFSRGAAAVFAVHVVGILVYGALFTTIPQNALGLLAGAFVVSTLATYIPGNPTARAITAVVLTLLMTLAASYVAHSVEPSMYY
jgi:hypothetical protein